MKKCVKRGFAAAFIGVIVLLQAITAFAAAYEFRTGEDDKLYWYENGVRQGTYEDPKGVLGDGTVRGREIYDPATNAWYWLDSVYNGAKAVGKEVWIPYIYQSEADFNENDIITNANASDDGLQRFVESAIRGRTGKWVRYDENGQMLKGWVKIEGALAKYYPEQRGNVYYYDHKTGLMAKGNVTLGGKNYYFNEVTGVLESGQDNSSSEEVTVERQVLYNDKNIKITATGMGSSYSGPELKLLIENRSGQNITVQTRAESINGYMVDANISADVVAGKNANDAITFFSSSLQKCGIEKIGTMEFYFHIFDSGSWGTIVDTEVVKVNTSVAYSYVQKYDDTGRELINKNGVRIVLKGLSEKSYSGPEVVLYIENNTNKDITIQTRDESVNGFMVDANMSEDIVSGKRAIGDITLFQSSLDENGITDIKEVELYFHIFDAETWDTIFDTDVVTMKF